MSRLARRIARRLHDEHGIEIDPGKCAIERTHATQPQREAGAWRWQFIPKPQGIAVGSPHTAIECAQANRLWIYRGPQDWQHCTWEILIPDQA